MILLKKEHYDQIVEYSVKELPNEACGLIGGRVDGDIKTVEKIYLLTNTDKSPEHFSMDPKEQFDAIKDMRINNIELMGNFHSHPESPSRPSEEDKRLAFDPTSIYMIISLEDRRKPVLKSFIINEDSVIEEGIEII